MGQSEFWQAPGNSRCFDTKLEDWKEKDMSKRSIGVLEYIDEHPLISKNEFEKNIGGYLERKYSWEKNDSIRGHFLDLLNL